VLVVGGGAVATRRVPALLDSGAEVVLVSPTLTPSLRALADAGRITWLARRFEPSDVDDCWLVQTAIDDHFAAQAVSEVAQQRRVFCVRADDRDAATAWTPAVTRHGPVTVAVSGGGAPLLAMAVRDEIREYLAERELPAGDEPASHGPAMHEPASHEPAGRRRPASTGSAGQAMAGGVALVGAGPGDPELITMRGRRLLAAADVVVADRLVPALLLDELGPEVELVDAAKIPHGPGAEQHEINRILVDRARAGLFVVRLKGGDPYLFGRGGEEVLACAAAGIAVTVVPGVTSALAAPAGAGIPVTHRGLAHELTVVSGHLPPDDPLSLVDWAALARLRGTVCVLMGLGNLAAITEALIGYGKAPDTPAAVVQEATTAHQRVVRARLADIASEARRQDIRAPAVVVFGAVVDVLTGPPNA
jgi:uroporphyrin-III C-methyltransferase/precorrin-2 dehydrogenase/sirohydrochlorin ferrochelatase